MRCIAAFLLALMALPAQAQQRVVVVPADAAIAIPARGAAAPPTVAATRPRLTRTGREGGRTARGAGGATDLTVQNLAVPALIGLPLLAAAGAATAAAVANGGAGGGAGTTPATAASTTSAPVRTR